MRSAELVWVAQTIACCGEIGDIDYRRDIAQRRVRRRWLELSTQFVILVLALSRPRNGLSFRSELAPISTGHSA